ncbi:MAG: histidinol dehydrogenase [Deltaproteobacteria bacterium]|nr:histidinol dehydrogenase [Deltaproteobacteria bacterium]
MRLISSKDAGFESVLSSVRARGLSDTARVEKAVTKILAAVKRRGDKAVMEYTKRFDGVSLSRFEVAERDVKKALAKVPKKDLRLIELAAKRIESFHSKGLSKSWSYRDRHGNLLGVKASPVERAGIYVPGGKAAYPSTVLMNALPARAAGVKEVVMTTPPSKDGINPYVMAAANISGVDRIFTVGGAQAIGALAFGTESIPKVDKITGPGNIYVATAKRLVYGTVGIDMIAGPSEILIINDGTGPASWLAADMLSQAEHDELASSILVTTSVVMADSVKKALGQGLKRLERQGIAAKSLARYGLIVVVDSLKEAAQVANSIAPEHLELFVKNPKATLKLIRNAGAVFLGRNTPEAAGDYIAGPNHTLPTGGAARFSSPLSADDFMKKTSVMEFSAKGLKALGSGIQRFAEIEGLFAHALSVQKRLG